ncbi:MULTISPECIES: hypothetical protein [unclassified Nostoc]|uniref:hypothetical protein n=1 Tax=unclassified Nostoc TaxID=2593658 RepID=UPI001DAF02D9|nr:hypothetical protein [Nostoc sp. JL23]MBN3877248.1 hypothetical protein [Nostoc sp. JL23]
MIINDLSHVETVLENENVQGGLAFASAAGKAYAFGPTITATDVVLSAVAVTKKYSKSVSYGAVSAQAG